MNRINAVIMILAIVPLPYTGQCVSYYLQGDQLTETQGSYGDDQLTETQGSYGDDHNTTYISYSRRS